MGVIREFGGSDKFDIGIFGFYDFYLVFIYDNFICENYLIFAERIYTYVSVLTVVYFSHICYESHPSCYFDCAYIGVSEGNMRDDSLATIGSQFHIYIIILFIPLS